MDDALKVLLDQGGLAGAIAVLLGFFAWWQQRTILRLNEERIKESNLLNAERIKEAERIRDKLLETRDTEIARLMKQAELYSGLVEAIRDLRSLVERALDRRDRR